MTKLIQGVTDKSGILNNHGEKLEASALYAMGFTMLLLVYDNHKFVHPSSKIREMGEYTIQCLIEYHAFIIKSMVVRPLYKK